MTSETIDTLYELAGLLTTDCMRIDGDQLCFVIDLVKDERLGLELPEAVMVLRKVQYNFIEDDEE